MGKSDFFGKVFRYSPGVVSFILSRKNKYDSSFLNNLNKPDLYPPNWAFAVVWPILYYLMGRAAEIIYHSNHKNYKQALTVFIIQLILNLVWSPVFFKQKNYKKAYIIIILLIVTLIINIKLFYDIDKLAGKLLFPYIIWLIYAAYLNKYILDNN
uniref:TspO/MBR family protein n=1 Tax=viral metagenome TaxID=1070528 RepID=A0A6C0IVP5_9ZZZZ